MPWVTPVSDRTQADVDSAKALIVSWRAQAQPQVIVTTSDLRGCFNYSDLNRIEGNTSYLIGEANLVRPGVPLDLVTRSDWGRDDVPTSGDIIRVIQNVAKLKERIAVAGGPSLPVSILSYTDANAIEENLALCESNMAPLETWQAVSGFTWEEVSPLAWGKLV